MREERHGSAAVFEVADIAFDELEVAPLRRGHQTLHLIEIALVARGKVIEADHALVELEQGLQQVAADEARHARDEPGFGLNFQIFLKLEISAHRCTHKRISES